MTFEEQARVILQYRKKEQVDVFIQLCKKIKTDKLLSEFKYHSQTSPELKIQKEAFRKIKEFMLFQIKTNIVFVEHKELLKGLEKAFMFICFNNALKTGGASSRLSMDDMFRLSLLKMYFEISFPKHSALFTKDSLLHQLGSALINKTLSDKIEQAIERMIDELDKLNLNYK